MVFAGRLVDRPVVSIAHPGGLRTSYEPVEAVVRAGQRVTAGTVLGDVGTGSPGCGAPACTGARCGVLRHGRITSTRSGLVVTTPVRLKPLHP